MLQPGAQQLHRCMFEGACIYSKVSMCTVASSLLLVSQGSRCQGAQQLHQWARGCGILVPVWPGMAGLGRREWESSACLDGIICERDGDKAPCRSASPPHQANGSVPHSGDSARASRVAQLHSCLRLPSSSQGWLLSPDLLSGADACEDLNECVTHTWWPQPGSREASDPTCTCDRCACINTAGGYT